MEKNIKNKMFPQAYRGELQFNNLQLQLQPH